MFNVYKMLEFGAFEMWPDRRFFVYMYDMINLIYSNFEG